MDRMLAEFAVRTDDTAAAAQATTAAHRIDIHTDTTGRIQQRGTEREHATASRRQEDDFCVLPGQSLSPTCAAAVSHHGRRGPHPRRMARDIFESRRCSPGHDPS